MKSTVRQFIADRWVSWLMELVILLVIAYFTISETRKTAEQTRAMLQKYDAAISAYAAQRAEAVDSAVTAAYEAARTKAGSISRDDVMHALEALKAEKKKQ